MFEIYDGRKEFYQWDSDCMLIADGLPEGGQVHFSNRVYNKRLTVETYDKDGVTVCNVPNILLQSSEKIEVYGYVIDEKGHRTICEQQFNVKASDKPSDYVYTETEVLDFKKLEKRVNEAIEQTGYYMPVLDSEGNLAWIPSNELFPVIAPVNIKGPKGDPGAARKLIVPELPTEDIDEDAVYLVKMKEEGDNKYTEYQYIEGEWEVTGSATVEVDLTDYVKKTDKATPTIAGLVRVFAGDYGLKMYNDILQIYKASNTDIDNKLSDFRPITPSILDYAVMKALTNSKNHAWTDEEKASALALLGGVQRVPTPNITRLYGENMNGTYMYELATKANNYSVAQRGLGGVLEVSTPTADAHATTKAYVDNLVGDVQTILTELHAYAETLKGGA